MLRKAYHKSKKILINVNRMLSLTEPEDQKIVSFFPPFWISFSNFSLLSLCRKIFISQSSD